MRLAWLLLGTALVARPALAHDHWINHGHYTNSKTGELCCGDEDCEMIMDDNVKTTREGYRLADGEVVPYAEALKSEDGHFWRCHRFDAAHSRRCFFAPQPASE